jgi:hypothetical protein
MQTYTVEFNTSKKFQDSNLVAVATVQTTSKQKAIEAVKFFLKSGIDPTDAIVTPCSDMQFSANSSFSAYLNN